MLQEVHRAAGAEAGAGWAPQALPHHSHPGWHQQKGDSTGTAFSSFLTVPWAFLLKCVGGFCYTSCSRTHNGATQRVHVKLSDCENQITAFHYWAADNWDEGIGRRSKSLNLPSKRFCCLSVLCFMVLSLHRLAAPKIYINPFWKPRVYEKSLVSFWVEIYTMWYFYFKTKIHC